VSVVSRPLLEPGHWPVRVMHF